MLSLCKTVAWFLRGMPLNQTQQQELYRVHPKNCGDASIICGTALITPCWTPNKPKRSHSSTLSAVEYLRPQHVNEQVAILVRLLMDGRKMTAWSAQIALREAGNPSVQAGRVLLAVKRAFERAGHPLDDAWRTTITGKRIKCVWLPMKSVEAMAELHRRVNWGK